MLHIDFVNIHQIATKNSEDGLSKSEIQTYSNRFKHYWDLVQSRKQGFIDLPYDTKTLTGIQTFTQEIRGEYKYIVILGIGGSMLGPKCILEALFNKLRTTNLEVICLDNIDPHQTAEVDAYINYEQTLFLVQTKSGGTPETLAQYFYFREKLEFKKLDVTKHLVIVTDPTQGYLREVANQEQIPSFTIPENVGGRFSVLSSVGLLITELIGLSATKMLQGAQETLEKQLDLAYKLATIQYLLSRKQKNINVLMAYSSRLKTLTEWYTQLLAESTGKKILSNSTAQNNNSNQDYNVGLTPLPSVGATDQHSQVQLFKEGPNNKLIMFLEVLNHQVIVPLPAIGVERFNFLSQKSFNKLLDAELQGTKQSLTESQRPNLTIQILQIDEHNLGSLFMLFELATAFLGEFLQINTFDQPGVERGKILAKEILSK